uniref:Uncharacterized protein n=1 Tax=Anguilla anguilla TaxID=7936 RepID=A0A0E9XJK6_ANGAN
MRWIIYPGSSTRETAVKILLLAN